jgi:Na+-transporting NADH:ubiquinone oxidoreductase subunit D
MSTESAVQESTTATSQDVKEPKEPLFSKKNKKLLTDPLDDSNPITVQVLGICSALAITVQVKQAIVMSLSVLAVMIGGNLIISLIRNVIPSRIRIIVQLVVVASLVILVDQVLKAYVYDVSKALSVFVGLIITNCIIMGRFEAFAMGNKPWPSILDAIGNAAGYGWILIAVAVVRELFGSGSLMGYQLIPQAVFDFGYMNNNLMILPPMALITVGVIIWIQRARNTKLIEEN